MKPDKNSPAVGEGNEHQRIFLNVQGMYDIGSVELKGWTVVSNNDLAKMKEQEEVLRGILRMLNDLGFNTDESVSAADTVDCLCQLYPKIKEACK